MTENQIEWARKRDELVSAAEEANARYNEMLYYGLGTEDEES